MIAASPLSLRKAEFNHPNGDECPLENELRTIVEALSKYDLHVAVPQLALLKRSLEHKTKIIHGDHRCIASIDGSLYRQLLFLAKHNENGLDLGMELFVY